MMSREGAKPTARATRRDEMNTNHIVIIILVCVVLLPFFIFPMNIVSSLVVGMFFGAEAGVIAFLLSSFFFVCMIPFASIYYSRKEKQRLAADPAYAARIERLREYHALRMAEEAFDGRPWWLRP
jgi:uncharacterized membrane protein